MTIELLCTVSFIRVSSVIEELLPFDCVNFNDFPHPRSLLDNQGIEFHVFYTEYI